MSKCIQTKEKTINFHFDKLTSLLIVSQLQNNNNTVIITKNIYYYHYYIDLAKSGAPTLFILNTIN